MVSLDNGSANEFYEDEVKIIVLDILKKYVKMHPNYFRCRDIINVILKAKKLARYQRRLRARLRTSFRAIA